MGVNRETKVHNLTYYVFNNICDIKSYIKVPGSNKNRDGNFLMSQRDL